MIAGFRKSLRGWATALLLFVALVAIVITGFGTGGFGGIGSLSGGGSAPTGEELATVGGRPITANMISERLTQSFNRARQQVPNLEMAEFLRQGAYDATFDQTVAAMAMQQYGEARGMAITRRMVDRFIVGLPDFQNLSGQFDNALFQRTLAGIGMSENYVRQEAARLIMQQQLIGPVAVGMRVPPGVARFYAQAALEQRRGSVGAVPVGLMAQGINPSDAEIARYYEANRAAFVRPERRAIKYAVFGPEQTNAAAPTEAEIQAVYRNSSATFGAREARNLQSIVLPTQAAADAFAQRLRGGTAFLAAAAQAGYRAEDVSFADRNRQRFAGETTPAVADAAFTAAEGAVVGPLRSELGFYVVRVDRVVGTPARTLESVRPAIVAEITRRKRVAALNAFVTQIEDQVSDGTSFEDIARGARLTVVTTPPVTRTGQLASGQAYGQADVQPLLAAAFDMDPENPDPSVETIREDARYALVSVERAEPAAPPPLAEVRDQVRAAVIRQQAQARARDLANRIAARINAGTPAARAFAEAQPRLPGPQTVTLRRVDIMRTDRPVPQALVTLFASRLGRAQVVPAPNNEAFLVVVAEQHTPGAAPEAPFVTSTQQQLQSTAAEDLAQQFVRSMELRADVQRNEEAIRAHRRQVAGNATPAAAE
jgi:peptidyl-prolyl cis-trans isomerase D